MRGLSYNMVGSDWKSTLLKLHHYLVKKKYKNLFSNKAKKKPGPKGLSQDVINAVVTMKQYNPRFGCVRIAMQINTAFRLDIDKMLYVESYLNTTSQHLMTTDHRG